MAKLVVYGILIAIIFYFCRALFKKQTTKPTGATPHDNAQTLEKDPETGIYHVKGTNKREQA